MIVDVVSKKLEAIFCLALFVSLIFCSGCTNSSDKKEIEIRSNISANQEKNTWFEDVTSRLGISHTISNGEETNQYSILESMGSGLGCMDFDRDGLEDFFFTGGGKIEPNRLIPSPCALWRNKKGTFSNVTDFAGVSASRFYTQGVACGDIDNDGFPDMAVTGYGGVQLFRNQGDGTFSEITTQSAITDSLWSTSIAFGDLNHDSNLDVYIIHYANWSFDNHPLCGTNEKRKVCDPGAFSPLTDSIYYSDGSGAFVDVTAEKGFVEGGRGLGIIIADLTQDDKVDVYIANDTSNNFFYENAGDGKFNEIGTLSGTATNSHGLAEGSMGVCTLDYDGDLLPDIWVCNYEAQAFALYKNDGYANFRYVTPSAGLLSLGLFYVAFGTVAADFDLDGDEDVVVSNGHVDKEPESGQSAQEPLFLENNGRSKLIRKQYPSTSYFGNKWRGRGVVSLDFDMDGDLDLAFSHLNQPCVVLENKSETDGKWYMFELIGTVSNRDAIGARIIFETSQRKILRNVVGGGSYMSQSSYRVHLGLPKDEELQSVQVRWPSGVVQDFAIAKKNTSFQVIENHSTLYESSR